jgi:hypothetical protein
VSISIHGEERVGKHSLLCTLNVSFGLVTHQLPMYIAMSNTLILIDVLELFWQMCGTASEPSVNYCRTDGLLTRRQGWFSDHRHLQPAEMSCRVGIITRAKCLSHLSNREKLSRYRRNLTSAHLKESTRGSRPPRLLHCDNGFSVGWRSGFRRH